MLQHLDHCPEPFKDPFATRWARAILLGLQAKPIYAGTVSLGEVERRRVKNRAARKARKINRARRTA